MSGHAAHFRYGVQGVSIEDMEINNTSQPEQATKPHPVHLVTPLSKYLAMLLFIALPFLGAYIGYTLAPENLTLNDGVIVDEIEEDVLDLQTEVYLHEQTGITFEYPVDWGPVLTEVSRGSDCEGLEVNNGSAQFNDVCERILFSFAKLDGLNYKPAVFMEVRSSDFSDLGRGVYWGDFDLIAAQNSIENRRVEFAKYPGAPEVKDPSIWINGVGTEIFKFPDFVTGYEYTSHTLYFISPEPPGVYNHIVLTIDNLIDVTDKLVEMFEDTVINTISVK